MDKTTIPYDTMSRTSVTSDSLFTKCCCCIPLRIGCFILGYISVLFNAVQFLIILAVTAFIGVKSHGFDHLDKDDADDDLNMDMKPILEFLGVLFILVLIVDFIWLIINIACLVGLHKKNPGPIRVYVGFATVRLLLVLTTFIRNISKNEVDPYTIIISCINLGISAYFILVYYVYARHLEKERKEERRQAATINAYIYPTKTDEKYLVA